MCWDVSVLKLDEYSMRYEEMKFWRCMFGCMSVVGWLGQKKNFFRIRAFQANVGT